MEFSLAIFDLGNTLFRTDWDKPFQIWSSATGLSEAELKSRYVWDHPTFELFQRGEVSAQQFHSHVCELLQTSLSYEDFVRGWTSIYAELYDDVVNAIANRTSFASPTPTRIQFMKRFGSNDTGN